MAATGTPTTNLGLRIMNGTDPVDVADINANSQTLDDKIGAVGSTSLQAQIDSINDKWGNYGTTQSPVTSLANLPINGCGYCVLDSSISPTGSTHSFAFIKYGVTNNNRYYVLVNRVTSSGTNEIYYGEMYDNTFNGWQEVALASKLNPLLYTKEYASGATLAGVQSDADALSDGLVGTFQVGYLNTNGAAAVGIPITGAYFVVLHKHNAARALLEFINLGTGQRFYNYKESTWRTIITEDRNGTNGAYTILVSHTSSTAVDTQESFGAGVSALSFITYPSGDMYGGVTQEHTRKTNSEYVALMAEVSGTLFHVGYLIDWANNKVTLKKNELPSANWTSRIYTS